MGKGFNQIKLLLFSGILLTAVALTACSSGDSSEHDHKRAQMTATHIDPRSVPLYVFQKESKAKDFSMERVNGETFNLANQQGKVVLLNIWATWCAPCHEETPEFVKMYQDYKDKGLIILGVSMDKQGKSAVEPFMKKYKVNYPVVIDRTGKVTDKYSADMGIPSSYIIGKDGNLRYYAVGPLTEKELKPKIDKLLAE